MQRDKNAVFLAYYTLNRRNHRRTGEGGDGPSPPPFCDILLKISQKDSIFASRSQSRPPPTFEFLCTPLAVIVMIYKYMYILLLRYRPPDVLLGSTNYTTSLGKLCSNAC